jgi:branched-subunit amino acid transport protein AzlD
MRLRWKWLRGVACFAQRNLPTIIFKAIKSDNFVQFCHDPAVEQ